MNYKKRFFNYLSSEKLRIILICVLVILFVSAQLAIPFLVGKALDVAINKDSNKLIGIIIAAFATSIIGVTAGYFFEYNVGLVTQNVIKKMRDDVFKKITSISMSMINSQTKGNLIQLEIGDVENIANGMFATFKSLIEGSLTILITIGVMFYINWILALAVILLSPLSVVAAKFIAKYSHKFFKNQAKLQSSLNDISSENLSNLELIQAFNYENDAISNFDKEGQKLYDHGRVALFSASWVNPTTRLVNNIISALVIIAGVLMIISVQKGNTILSSINATLTFGGLVSFISYTNQYTKPFNEVASVASEFETSLFSFKRLNDFLNNEDEVDEGNIDIGFIDNISFFHTNFSYDENKELIKDFSLDIKKGEKVAIVGPTGAGKTTLVNLIMNFYSPIGGDILYNLTSQKDIKKKSLRSNFGMVLQDSWVFKGSVIDNVRYGNNNASEEDVIEACKKVHADSFIRNLPNGYDTIISSNDGLSEGQRQMLMIARVMLTKPNIVILDEATSNVDTRNEKLINDAFDQVLKGRTSIIIAHRLSTIVHADTIIVLKNGHIEETGNHKELMNKKGFYYSMYNSQFEKDCH